MSAGRFLARKRRRFKPQARHVQSVDVRARSDFSLVDNVDLASLGPLYASSPIRAAISLASYVTPCMVKGEKRP